MRIETIAVHAGRRIDPATAAVAQPIHLTTTFLRDEDGEYSRGYSYGREDNPNRKGLEQCLAALDGGKEAIAFSSGLAAVTAVLQSLEPGDHVLAPDDVYYGVRKLGVEVFGKWGLQIEYIDMTNLDGVRAAVKPNTKLIWVESPSNPLLKITDLAAISEIARKANAMTVCDSTFASPVLQRPLEHGIDVVMYSTTKYHGGHSDVTGGALISAHDNYLTERAKKARNLGAAPSPFDCWLLLRGIDTLPWRVRAASMHSAALAEFLCGHPRVERVFYPGLATHPNYAVAARQMKGGFGGMLSFLIKGGKAEAMAVTNKTHLFTRATSLGGTHSLIEHRASVEGPTSKTPQNLLRVSTGLEHIDDLIEDMRQALD
jgi:cystathionine gamma-synthase